MMKGEGGGGTGVVASHPMHMLCMCSRPRTTRDRVVLFCKYVEERIDAKATAEGSRTATLSRAFL